MRFRQGVQAEILLSLVLVMLTGTGLLAAVFLEINHERVDNLHGLLGRGFVAEALDTEYELRPSDVGLWWRIDRDHQATELNGSAESIDEETLALGRESVGLGTSLVRSGAPWTPIRFATPIAEANGAIVGRIDAPVSGTVLLVLLITDVLVFGLFGVTLLRRRVVGPLHRLAVGVREVGEGGLPATLRVEGVGEIQELGSAFNEMQASLAARTGALEKAVRELRTVNADLIQAREGLGRAERLAMVGSLAAGVAHEVGNPMGALLGFLDVASRDEGIGPEARHCLQRAGEQGERVRLILRQLLDFSRPPQIDHVPISLELVAHQVTELVRAQRDFSDVEFEVVVEEGVGWARGDASLASQIVLNLALNAVSALKNCSSRRVRIEIRRGARERRSDDPSSGQRSDPFRLDSIVCCVGDSGPGISLEEPERIFDPFFTTKGPGEGTGLGLANARRLAEEMGGSVELGDEPSCLGGALFRFCLPVDGSEEANSFGVREVSD